MDDADLGCDKFLACAGELDYIIFGICKPDTLLRSQVSSPACNHALRASGRIRLDLAGIYLPLTLHSQTKLLYRACSATSLLLYGPPILVRNRRDQSHGITSSNEKRNPKTEKTPTEAVFLSVSSAHSSKPRRKFRFCTRQTRKAASLL
jgi:hypothetical protein